MNPRILLDRDAEYRISALLMARELGGGGGIERDVSKFARRLRSYGIAPHVACFNPGGARWLEIEAAGIPVLALPLKSVSANSLITSFRMLRRYITEHDIRLVHAFDFSSNILGVPLARMSGVPVTLSSHLWQRAALPCQMRLLLRLFDHCATALFTNSHAVAEELIANSHISRKRIYVCQNGFEPEEFHPLASHARPANLASASVVIGTVAVLREEKNLPSLIEAFARGVWPVDRRACLLIVGDGPMKAALQTQAQSLGVAEACRFEPATPNPANWMRAIDIYVLPSTSESFSNALLEAMACGCCPVASRVGGTPELIAHNERGLLFESGCVQELAWSLRNLILDSARRQEMAFAASRFVHENLTIDIAAARLASIYLTLLRQKRSTQFVRQSQHREIPQDGNAGSYRESIPTTCEQERSVLR